MISNEDKAKMFLMHLEGHSYKEIGDQFGISRQGVEQMLKKGVRSSRINNISYPGISKWMVENGVTLKKLAELTGSNTTTLGSYLRKKRLMRIGEIKKFLKVTGLTFEEAFGEEDE